MKGEGGEALAWDFVWCFDFGWILEGLTIHIFFSFEILYMMERLRTLVLFYFYLGKMYVIDDGKNNNIFLYFVVKAIL